MPSIDQLTAEVRGRVLLPGQPGFADEHAGFNTSVEHHPAVIVRATGAADVIAAVRYARAAQLPVAVQATGHGVSTPADGAVLISTRQMTGLRIGPGARTARVEAGVRWEQVIHEAAQFGLAPLNGSSPLVGAVSYTLGGGMGVMAHKYGYAADHVRELDLVTADGELVHASPHERPDLFWALRGGKGNFGVVTSMVFDLMPVSRLYGGALLFDGVHAADVLRRYVTWTATVPEELTSSIALLRLPDLPQVPELLRDKLMVHVRVAFLGTAAEGETWLAPLRAVAPTVQDTVVDRPYREVEQIHSDPTDPFPYYERCTMLRHLPAAAVDTLLDLAGPGTDPTEMVVEVRHLGGALRREPAEPNAVGNRDAEYCLATLTMAPVAETADPEALPQKLAQWSTGRRYLNFLSGPGTAEQTQDAYDPDTYERLTRVKAAYDPQNLFRVNHNIPPVARPQP